MNFSYRTIKIGSALSCMALLLAGCQNMPAGQIGTCTPLGGSQAQNAGFGAIAGALSGAVLGSTLSSKPSAGARKGAILGALVGALTGSQYERMIGMTEMTDGSVKLDMPGSIVFASGSAEINPAFASTLQAVGRSITKFCDVTATVVGHTDNTGSDAINDKLSLERTNAVVNQLARDGIPMARLRADRRGSREPVASNASDAGRAQNRRVEVLVRPPAT